ncbi:glycoside hydrolase family 97 catalytic domain-containing protein [Nocardia sp. NRRL S-836]|uniref:glycoside hydrolase family 97 catalytic domain-containing protein n=1 Tax=Nocardia sp. NRRL S-836 TaxID=1519492 RepID=UPI0006ADEC01|nr:glycoside hydrolase family 97 catalytic domain-containing protein [Nocardia sp. NRRL S-836]KOV80842.1 alpha-glucosidase [Nocardia sp. NRRL S-836]
MSRLLAALTTLLLLLPAPATAAPGRWRITGPSPLVATVELAGGVPTLSVSRAGQTVLAAAPIGLRTTTADLTTGLRVVSRRDRVVTERYSMTTGKQRQRSATMTETTLTFDGAARFDVVVRVAPDGVAYRYVLPAAMTVTGEASAFRLPADAPAWLLPYNAWYEANRVRTTAGAANGEFGHPSLFRVGDQHVLLTESDVDGRHSGSRLRHTTGDYEVALADPQVTLTKTPWRTAIIGDLGTVSTSTLVDDLASPSKLADTSWIRPGKVAWSWLSEHDSPRSFERQKQYVDFAARTGWPYALIDEGWSSAWVPELVRYARARGVEILLWLHWSDLDTAEERDTLLPRFQRWGVKGVKIDFMESDSQARYQWYDAVLAKTASLKLMVNFHGSTIPHGLARTWPHIMTMEGVRGAENYPPAANNPVQFFTRNVVGSMDYTPVSLEVGTREASVAHEVALPVVYESGWTHFADKPEAYERHPQALRFLNQVPTTWDETRLVSGDPDTHAVVARRNGTRWFLGAISADARTVDVPLGFLGGGQWLVETVRDPAERGDVTRDRQVLPTARTLSVAVGRNGGFAAVACPYRPGLQTCDQAVPQVPATTLSITPTEVDVAQGTSFSVSGTFTSTADVSDVVLTVAPPAGWTVTGAPVTRATLRAGESITGRWDVRAGGPVGFTDVPVYAEFRAHQTVHVEQAVRAFVPPPAPSGTPFVSDLPFVSESNGWGPVERDRSNGETSAGDGRPLQIAGVTYAKGLGTHAPADVTLYLGRGCRAFDASVGLDDETTSPGSVNFQVYGDGRLLHDSGVVRGGDPARPVSVDTTGVRMLDLRVTDGGDGRNFDHADWADARLTC